MISVRDPATMALSERLAELAGLLAVGYLRHIVTAGRITSKEPSMGAESMALCDQVVNRIEMPPGKEIA